MYIILKKFCWPLALVASLAATLASTQALAKKEGISDEALAELSEVGVNKYLGQYTPISSEDVGDGWVKHTFDSAGGEGPVCIDGSTYSMFTRKGKDRKDLVIMLQGGGACWQGLTACSQDITEQEPPFDRVGMWDFDNKENPFAKRSIAYLPYCDGSVFAGDNTVIDPSFVADNGVTGVREHRGLRNLSAGMDVARDTFKQVKNLTITGSSAGGIGAAAFAPFLARFLYGNKVKSLTVFNDAGPISANLDAQDAVAARANDWQLDKFYPASCSECGPYSQPLAIVKWRLDNDSTIREAFYSTDADETGIQFASVNLPGFFDPLPPIIPPPAGLSHNQYRDLVLDTENVVYEAHPDRYRRFIVSGDDSHTALQSDLFYTQELVGTTLNSWISSFLSNKKTWWDLIEDFKALPATDS